LDQVLVQLDPVRGQVHHPAQAGVRHTDVIDGDLGAALAQPVELTAQPTTAGRPLVFGEFDLDPAQVLRQDRRDGRAGQHGRREVHRENGADRAPVAPAHRLTQGAGFEGSAQAQFSGPGEPLFGATDRGVRESGQRLVAVHDQAGQRQLRLENDLRPALGQDLTHRGQL
jgi:hypothetical protein